MELFSLTDIKKKNLSDVFHYIYHHPGCSRQTIATALTMSLPTVTQHLATLTEKRLIEKSGQIHSNIGRKAAAYSILPKARIAIGVEILSHKITIVALNLYGKKETKEQLHLKFAQTDAYFERIRTFILDFIHMHQYSEEQLLGIGFAVQGLTSRDGTKITYGKILNCSEIDISVFADYFSIPCRFIHDAECAAISELWENAELQDAVYLSLSHHLGGAIILNGTLQSGMTGKSGTFEHMTLVPNGLPCYCGKHGCAESYCSGYSLLESDLDLENFFESKLHGDTESRRKWRKYLKYLALLINNLHLVIESPVILGGHIAAYLSDDDLAALQKALAAQSTFHDPVDYIMIGACRRDAVAIGAALPYIQEFLKTISFV